MNINDIKTIHIELTTFCNAKCKFCPTQIINQKYGIIVKPRQLDFQHLKRLPLKTISHITFIGTYGEPTLYSKLFDLLLYIRSINPKLSIHIDTNGSTNDSIWWQKLAQKLCYNDSNTVSFCLDGLEDTHTKYRKGTIFQKIIQNIKEFTNNRGRAIIKFILFKHNEHQVNQIIDLAKTLKCKKVDIIKSFFYDNELEAPTDITSFFDSCCKSNIDKTTCDFFDSKSVYVGSDGNFYPCCYIYARTIDKQFEYIFNYKQKDILYDNINKFLDSDFVKYLETKTSCNFCMSRCALSKQDLYLKQTLLG